MADGEVLAETPGVIGYDLINEPWGDERNDLAPLYRANRVFPPNAAVAIEPSDAIAERDESRQVLICRDPRATTIHVRVTGF